jgi:hypothetical protein
MTFSPISSLRGLLSYSSEYCDDNYHNTNVTVKDLILFNVPMETYSCDEKPAAAIQGHLTKDVILQINRPLVCRDSLWLPAQLG